MSPIHFGFSKISSIKIGKNHIPSYMISILFNNKALKHNKLVITSELGSRKFAIAHEGCFTVSSLVVRVQLTDSRACSV